jgi:hypothetical protein
VKLANQIPIKGGNVINVVYDATDLKMWVTYAHGSEEAYQRPSVLIDLRQAVGPDVSKTRTSAP